MQETGCVELGGVFGGAGDFRDAVDAGCSTADVGRHGGPQAIFLDDCDLRRAARGLRQRAHDRPARQINFKVVATIASGVAQQRVRRARKRRGVGRPAAQRRFSLRISPRLVRDAAERHASLLYEVPIEFEPDSNGHQRERIRQSVSDLQIGVVRREALRRQLYGRDDLAGVKASVPLWRILRQPVEVRKLNHAIAGGACGMDLRLQDRERNAHVRRVDRNAGVARA